MGMLAGVTDCRRSRKWGCRGSLVWGFKPGGVPAIPGRGPHLFGRVGGENHAALAEWGPCGGDTTDGARSLNHELLLLFLRYGIQTGQREKEGLCICGYSKGL